MDTGTTPISGAVVHLEKGGATATTGADGRFTIVTGNTDILPGNGRLFSSGLSARFSGNIITVMIAERSIVEVAIFDLNGKVISTVQHTMNAGSHCISLPYQRAGVYLYKVKAGDRVLVLKGTMVDGLSSANALLTQGSSLIRSAKQAKAKALTSNVIIATKENMLNYRSSIGNTDTSGIVIRMIANAGDITDVDGNVYQTVRIGNQVWMAENLRVTKYNDGITAIPKDTSTETWAYPWWTPKYCYYNNSTNADSIKKYGALYNWYVVIPTNPMKVALKGWHVPSDSEWDTLQNYLIANGYNWDGTTTLNKIAKSLAAKTDWYIDTFYKGSSGCDPTTNNRSGFSAFPGGFRGYNGSFFGLNGCSYWWSTTVTSEFETGTWSRSFGSGNDNLVRSMSGQDCGLSVRLVKD